MAIYINPDWAGTESGTKAEPYAGIVAAKTAEGGYQDNETYYWKAGTEDVLTADQTVNKINMSFLSYTDTEDDSYDGFAKPIISMVGDNINFLVVAAGTGSTFRGLDVKGGGSLAGSNGRGFSFFSSTATNTEEEQNSLIEDCIVREHGFQSIRIYASLVTIRDCEIYDCGQDNIFYAGGNDILIEDNVIYGTGKDGTQADNIQGAPITSAVANGDRCIIRRNHCTNDSTIKHCIIGPGTDVDSVDCICEDNVMVSNCLVSINIKGNAPIVRRNKIHATGSDHLYLIGATVDKTIAPIVYGNLVIDNTTILDVSGTNYNAIIFANCINGQYYDNVIISTSGQTYLKGIRFNQATASGHTVRNNILIGMYEGIAQTTAVNIESNNLFYNVDIPTGTEAEPATDTWANSDASAESTLLNNDPLFIDAANGNYNLQQSSDCVGAGVKHWGTKPRPSGYQGDPKPDTHIDIGFQSTWNANHPANL